MGDERKLFSQFIAEHREGVADRDLTDALYEVVEAVLRTEKAGELTVKLKITAEGDMLAVLDTCTAKVPEKLVAKLYWLDLRGQLTRNNPLQPPLPYGEDATAP